MLVLLIFLTRIPLFLSLWEMLKSTLWLKVKILEKEFMHWNGELD